MARIYCRWKDERFTVDIPPTYVDFFGRMQRVQDTLTSLLLKAGYRGAKPKLPLKTLAVESSLARYGRNNICFVPEMGSHLQLVGLYTDSPCLDDSWGQAEMLERCNTCDACLQNCPTGAILSSRFLLQADRCLTYFNENDVALPNWIDPAWHNSLIGCMACQSVCPENRTVRKRVEEKGEFDEEETALLLARTPLDSLPPVTASKLNALRLCDYQILCRNLAALILG